MAAFMWDPALPGMSTAERGAIFDEMNRVIAALHKVDYTAWAFADYGKPDKYLERQVARWSSSTAPSENEKIEARQADRLAAAEHSAGEEPASCMAISASTTTVFHPTEPRMLPYSMGTVDPRHPLADFAYHCMTWRLSPAVPRLAGYDWRRWAFPRKADYVAGLLQAHRPCADSAARMGDYMAFNMFRLAGILARHHGRACKECVERVKPIETGSAPDRWPKSLAPVERLLASNYHHATSPLRTHHGFRYSPKVKDLQRRERLHGPAHLSERKLSFHKRGRRPTRQGQPWVPTVINGAAQGQGPAPRPVEPVLPQSERGAGLTTSNTRRYGEIWAARNRAGSLQLLAPRHRNMEIIERYGKTIAQAQ